MEMIYNRTNQIFKGDHDAHYLVVGDRAYRFAGDKPCKLNGADSSVVDALIAHISTYGPFYRHNPGIVPRQTMDSPCRSLVRTLYGLYNNIPLSEAAKIKAKVGLGEPIHLPDGEDEDIRRFTVFDFMPSNLSTEPMSLSRTASHADGAAYDLIGVDGRAWYVPHGLTAITKPLPWQVENNHLNSKLNDAHISVAEIADAYLRGEIAPCQDIVGAVEQLHTVRQANCQEVDHLNGSPDNNLSWNLALVSHSTNAKLGRMRCNFLSPFYFFTANDRANNQVVVEIGIQGEFSRRFAFEALENDCEAEFYLDLLNRWKAVAQDAGCYRTKYNSGVSLTEYWADPSRADDPDNPIVALLGADGEPYTPGCLVYGPTMAE